MRELSGEKLSSIDGHLLVDSTGNTVRNADVPVVNDKNRVISPVYLNPSYSDKRFGYPDYKARTIFLVKGVELEETPFGGEEVDGLHYVYSDRFDHRGWASAWERVEAENRFQNGTAAFYEAVIQRITEDPEAELQHIMAGINSATLYSYLVFGTKHQLPNA